MVENLQKFPSEISVKPTIENWIADTGAHSQDMAHTQSKVICLKTHIFYGQIESFSYFKFCN